MSLGDWLRRWFNRLVGSLRRPAPDPSFENVIPAGPGYYRFSRGKWRRIEARYLSDTELFEFALDAMIALARSEIK